MLGAPLLHKRKRTFVSGLYWKDISEVIDNPSNQALHKYVIAKARCSVMRTFEENVRSLLHHNEEALLLFIFSLR